MKRTEETPKTRSEVAERILAIIRHEYGEGKEEDNLVRGAKTRFAEALGIAKQTISGWLSQTRTPPQSNSLEVIFQVFPHISRDWLLYGKGQMLQTEGEAQTKPKLEENIGEITSVTDSYISVAYTDLRLTAGWVNGDFDQSNDTEYVLVPREYGIDERCIVARVSGDSMNDGSARSMVDGDQVLIKPYEPNFGEIPPIRKHIFAIFSREGNVIKQISEFNKEEGYIVCHSFNSRYEDYRIELADIYALYIVVKFVSKNISLY